MGEQKQRQAEQGAPYCLACGEGVRRVSLAGSDTWCSGLVAGWPGPSEDAESGVRQSGSDAGQQRGLLRLSWQFNTLCK